MKLMKATIMFGLTAMASTSQDAKQEQDVKSEPKSTPANPILKREQLRNIGQSFENALEILESLNETNRTLFAVGDKVQFSLPGKGPILGDVSQAYPLKVKYTEGKETKEVTVEAAHDVLVEQFYIIGDCVEVYDKRNQHWIQGKLVDAELYDFRYLVQLADQNIGFNQVRRCRDPTWRIATQQMVTQAADYEDLNSSTLELEKKLNELKKTSEALQKEKDVLEKSKKELEKDLKEGKTEGESEEKTSSKSDQDQSNRNRTLLIVFAVLFALMAIAVIVLAVMLCKKNKQN